MALSGVLSQTNSCRLVLATPSKSQFINSLPTLEISCLSFSDPHPLFSIACGLFLQNTGGGIPSSASLGFRAPQYRADSPLASRFSSTRECSPISFRMNTCKSVSKQRTLTPFRMNTCEKTGGGGVIVNETCRSKLGVLSASAARRISLVARLR